MANRSLTVASLSGARTCDGPEGRLCRPGDCHRARPAGKYSSRMSVRRRKNKPNRETPGPGAARPRVASANQPATVQDYSTPAPFAAGPQLLARQLAVGGLLAAGALLWVGIGAGRGIGL